MPTQPETLDLLARRGLADSAHWFPELHDRGRTALAVHFALGLAGELGELVEWLDEAAPPYAPELAAELADVAIYALDLVAALDLPAGEVFRERELSAAGTWPQLVVAAGQTINLVKKLNRGDELDELGRTKLRDYAGQLVAEIVALADVLGYNLVGEIDAKREILNARWGTRDALPMTEEG